jgi:hypothetical protein
MTDLGIELRSAINTVQIHDIGNVVAPIVHRSKAGLKLFCNLSRQKWKFSSFTRNFYDMLFTQPIEEVLSAGERRAIKKDSVR